MRESRNFVTIELLLVEHFIQCQVNALPPVCPQGSSWQHLPQCGLVLSDNARWDWGLVAHQQAATTPSPRLLKMAMVEREIGSGERS